MAAPNTSSDDVHLEMSEPNNYRPPPQGLPPSHNTSLNPSLNVSRAESDMDRGSMRTEDMSDIGVDPVNIGMRYACPNLGCGTTDRPVYSNPKYGQGANGNKKRYPTLDRPPSRAPSQSTVQSVNQSTADLVGKQGANAEPDSSAMAKFKSFWKDPRYDKLRAGLLILLLVIILLLIIILPIVYRKPAEEKEEVIPEENVVTAPLAVCGGGELFGVMKDGVAEYKGIPYAVPPVDERRWQPAIAMNAEYCKQHHESNAVHFGHQCYQSSSVDQGSNESEDCLYLNIWTPSNYTAVNKLPVMVYFHDGDFRSGNGHQIAQYPVRRIVKEGQFVLVSMNYRLQALGFMSVEALPDSNVGLTDMMVALQWVQDNIAGFGGDKSQVTAFGLGSGATAILALLNANTAGLIHRAWLMSPGIVLSQPLLASQAGNAEFVRNVGCQLPDQVEVKRCLYGKTAAEILAAVPLYTGPQWAQPQKFDVPQQNNVTGPYIVADNLIGGEGTFDSLKAGRLANKVPIIIGNADAEADIRPPVQYFGDGTKSSTLTDQQFRTNVQDRLTAFNADIMARIQNDYPNLETELGFSRLVTDIRAICPMNQVAKYLNDILTPPVYRYIYEFKPVMKVNAFDYDFWARYTFHGIDMLAFFGALDGEEFSPYFQDSKRFSDSLRAEIFKFIKGEYASMSWVRMPQYMKLTSSAVTTTDDGSYPRNCTHWSSMIPDYSWSN